MERPSGDATDGGLKTPRGVGRRLLPRALRSRYVFLMAKTGTARTIELELPAELARFALPEGVDRRLHTLLDRQDRGEVLSDDERAEAEGLVDLADLLSLVKLRAR